MNCFVYEQFRMSLSLFYVIYNFKIIFIKCNLDFDTLYSTLLKKINLLKILDNPLQDFLEKTHVSFTSMDST